MRPFWRSSWTISQQPKAPANAASKSPDKIAGMYLSFAAALNARATPTSQRPPELPFGGAAPSRERRVMRLGSPVGENRDAVDREYTGSRRSGPAGSPPP